MKKAIVYFLSLLGVLFMAWGVLPVLADYPYSDGPNSGPSNAWELIVMISYEDWGWLLCIGFCLVFAAYLGGRRVVEK
ncbi:hypothetical protein ACFO9Q_00580 [Paenibacillus sp. GCM10023252]|uniref:hypothetical protein n=1 Tax=Paenibacillus sp. GCM10023252 TaxID=3252649 RepID=UPI00361CC6B0